MVTPRTLRPFLGALNTSMSVLSPWVRYGRWLATQYRLLLSRQVNRLFLFLPGAEPQDRFLLYKPIQSSKIIKICGILQPSPTSSHFPFVKLVKPRPITGASSSSSGSAIFEDLFFLTLARLNGDQLAVDVNGLWLVDAYCLDLFGLPHFGTHMYIMLHIHFQSHSLPRVAQLPQHLSLAGRSRGTMLSLKKSSWSHVKKRFPSVAIKVFWRTPLHQIKAHVQHMLDLQTSTANRTNYLVRELELDILLNRFLNSNGCYSLVEARLQIELELFGDICWYHSTGYSLQPLYWALS